SGERNAAAVLSRRQSTLQQEFPNISLALVPMPQGCGAARRADGGATRETSPTTAGPWAHVIPPGSVPAWLNACKPFAGVFTFGRAEASNGHRLDLEPGAGDLGVV